jgi:hypothetical protein
MRPIPRKIFKLGILCVTLAWIGFVPVLRADERKGQTDSQLRSVLTKSVVKLGDLAPWQKILFQEEVLAQPQRFVRNYQVSAGSANQNGTPEQDFKADVDTDSIRSYLRFYGSKSLEGQPPKAVFLLKPDSACSVCIQSLPTIKTWVRNRLEKRGFLLEDISLEENHTGLIGASLEDWIEGVAKQKNARFLALVQWAPLPVEDLDSAHADEKVYSLSVSFRTLGSSSASIKKSKEVLDLESFDSSLARVWTDAMTELGAKIVADEKRLVDQTRKELSIEVSGKLSFQQFKKVKLLLESQLKEVGSLEERSISQHRFIFAILTQKSREEIKNLLSHLPPDSGVGSLFEWTIQ